jgi:hypothetical protein
VCKSAQGPHANGVVTRKVTVWQCLGCPAKYKASKGGHQFMHEECYLYHDSHRGFDRKWVEEEAEGIFFLLMIILIPCVSGSRGEE